MEWLEACLEMGADPMEDPMLEEKPQELPELEQTPQEKGSATAAATDVR
eukprot:COSAG04_NODE_2597_length_3874_cov_1.578013_6_plen_49_part_00